MMLLSWQCCRLIAYLVRLPPIPSTPANPYAVWETITQTGDGWGRQVVFVSWLVNLWGLQAAKRIWDRIRGQRQQTCTQEYHASQRQNQDPGSPV